MRGNLFFQQFNLYFIHKTRNESSNLLLHHVTDTICNALNHLYTSQSDTMAGGDTPKKEKKEKKDKKRKSEAADLGSDEPIKPEVVPPAEGTASAEAVIMDVDAEKAAKKAKKDKRKSVGGATGEAAAADEQDQKVSREPIRDSDGEFQVEGRKLTHFPSPSSLSP